MITIDLMTTAPWSDQAWRLDFNSTRNFYSLLASFPDWENLKLLKLSIFPQKDHRAPILVENISYTRLKTPLH